jgi:carboxymethylenebutenolidase
MPKIQDSATICDSIVQATIDRRGLMGLAALSAAGLAAPAAAAAIASPADARLATFKGRYAIHGGKIINGYFASPHGKTKLDVVIVIPGERGLDARAEATVRRHALAGYLAIAPDLAAKQGDVPAGASRDAVLAELIGVVPNLKHLPHGNGKVTVVAA